MPIYPPLEFNVEDLIKENRTCRSNIEEIKTWLLNTPNIPDMSPEQISLFLLACNNNLKSTKKTISFYFKIKSESPELFSNRSLDCDGLQEAFKVTKMALFPKLTKEGYCVCMAKLRDTWYYNFDLSNHLKAAFMLIDLALYKNPPIGLLFVIDLKGVGLMHLTRLKLGAIKKLCQFLQEGLPAQLKALHVINSTYVFDKALMICKPFMNKELYELIKPHPGTTDMEEFFEKYIPRDCMPKDYGGNLPDFETICCDTQNELRKLENYFDVDEKQTQTYKQ